MIASILGGVFWFALVGLFAGLLIWAVRGFRRTHTWYVALLAAGAACYLVCMGCLGAAVLADLVAFPRSMTRTVWEVSENLQKLGGWVFLLGTACLIIGGSAFYVAYPTLDVPGPGRDGESNGGDG